MPTFCFIVPMLIPWYVMNETIWNSWFVAAAFRYILSLHFTWLVNSAAHIYGMRRKNITNLHLKQTKKKSLLSLSNDYQIDELLFSLSFLFLTLTLILDMFIAYDK